MQKNDLLSNLISVANFLSKSLRAFLISLEANLLAFTHAGWSLSLYFTNRHMTSSDRWLVAAITCNKYNNFATQRKPDFGGRLPAPISEQKTAAIDTSTSAKHFRACTTVHIEMTAESDGVSNKYPPISTCTGATLPLLVCPHNAFHGSFSR